MKASSSEFSAKICLLPKLLTVSLAFNCCIDFLTSEQRASIIPEVRTPTSPPLVRRRFSSRISLKLSASRSNPEQLIWSGIGSVPYCSHVGILPKTSQARFSYVRFVPLVALSAERVLPPNARLHRGRHVRQLSAPPHTKTCSEKNL